jgi:hemin uptake protein HemP
MREADLQPVEPGFEADATRAAELADADPKVRIISSDALLSGRGALAIRHKQAIYYLRETRFGKLILTK